MRNPARDSHDLVGCIEAATADCESVLELGCGTGSKLAACSCSYRCGVDAYLPYLEMARKKWGHLVDGFVHCEALKFVSEVDRTYDAVLMVDFLEHLERPAAMSLLSRCALIAKRRIVLYCPEGDQPQDQDVYGLGGDAWQTHRSIWTLDDLERLGFDTVRWTDRHGPGLHALFALWVPKEQGAEQ